MKEIYTNTYILPHNLDAQKIEIKSKFFIICTVNLEMIILWNATRSHGCICIFIPKAYNGGYLHGM